MFVFVCLYSARAKVNSTFSVNNLLHKMLLVVKLFELRTSKREWETTRKQWRHKADTTSDFNHDIQWKESNNYSYNYARLLLFFFKLNNLNENNLMNFILNELWSNFNNNTSRLSHSWRPTLHVVVSCAEISEWERLREEESIKDQSREKPF